MFAGATTIVLSAIDFPNGGGGFTGRKEAGDLSGTLPVRRPELAEGDTAYYRYVVVVCALMFARRARARRRKARASLGCDP